MHCAHTTRGPLLRRLPTPHGYSTQLRATVASQAMQTRLPCPLPHQSRALWSGPEGSGRQISAEGAKCCRQNCQVRPAARITQHLSEVGQQTCNTVSRKRFYATGCCLAPELCGRENAPSANAACHTVSCTGAAYLAAWLQQGGAAQPQRPVKALTGTRAKRQALLRQMQCLPHPRIATPLLCT